MEPKLSLNAWPDAEAGLESQEPIVFAEDPPDQAPSLGQQVSGEAKQVEFVVQRRGKDYVLRICDRVAFRRPGAGNKVCSLGKVTQVDEVRAQIGVHRYVPDATGLRLKWRLGFTDEEGRLTPGEGARPCVESVTIRRSFPRLTLTRMEFLPRLGRGS